MIKNIFSFSPSVKFAARFQLSETEFNKINGKTFHTLRATYVSPDYTKYIEQKQDDQIILNFPTQGFLGWLFVQQAEQTFMTHAAKEKIRFTCLG